MEIKAGDRVHVTRLDGEKVDFYATLRIFDEFRFELTDCSNTLFNNFKVSRPNTEEYGLNGYYYYTLATDEEDTEEPVIQRTTDTHDPVNKPSHYMLGDIEVKDIIAIVADKYHKGSVAHNVASALEYQMRAPGKNGLEDIKKARKCLDFAIENWED
ncbi:DUF3310 domain-containing protein [Mammaliicoccus sciuri]|uniref:DUF3310 domain-containing protein n=1 Tax=Mammaliicoccus sciuri TaxID=1296 RepID=UPI001FB202E6|nr:DUF3310 domain-containing protein [Mammaliicoccus sciuri]MCJ1774666.1 DUF3310 domain-containing protein [Mammaliicoccus sciuri]